MEDDITFLYIIEVYKNVEFEGDCLGMICKDLGLEDVINCRTKDKKKGNNTKCDCDNLARFAETIRKGNIEIPASVACAYSDICRFDDCLGKKEERDTNFYCNLAELIKGGEKTKKKAAKKNQSQLHLLFK